MQLPCKKTIIDDPVDHRGKTVMKFRLVYAGDLLKAVGRSGKKSRAWEKHSIRREFHEQIKKLWETHPALKEYGNKTVAIDDDGTRLEPEVPFLQHLARRYERAGNGFIPLMTEYNGLVCDLDILFLRPEKPGAIRDSAGDIDNRIKTLLDALRIPSDGSEMKRQPDDDPDPNPMYCLMQDDKLITSLKVETDRLLFPAGNTEHEAMLVIQVETAQVDPFGSPWELHL